MGRKKTGALDTPRNRIIVDLHRKGMSYSKISRELLRRGFDVTSQRCQQIVKSRQEMELLKKEGK
tara:strand:+ start:903 stop:1097 length:195 start_codon:yes stop_codon:yes gene_type:complete